jgi:hypothetical protein
MTKHARLFQLPAKLETRLARLLTYWEGLRRGGNEIPFSDDVNLSSAPDLAEYTMIIESIGDPPRFRFALVGRTVTDRYGGEIDGRFLDEMDARDPIDQIVAQCRATVETRGPSYFRHEPGNKPGASPYGRLLLPLWGDGRVNMLLGGIT